MSVSFHEIQFPPTISEGATGGPRFSTSVQTLSSGFEHRNINWSKRRGEWDVSSGIKTDAEIDALLKFFHARAGRAYGFRFKDWGDYRLPRWIRTPGDLDAVPVCFTTDGSAATFQIVKVYADIAGTYSRLIQKPVAGSVRLLNNGVEIFTGSPADFSVDTTTGIVTLSNAIKSTTGHLISVACEFDVPVRFDTDEMKIMTTVPGVYSWGAIPVVEIRDIT